MSHDGGHSDDGAGELKKRGGGGSHRHVAVGAHGHGGGGHEEGHEGAPEWLISFADNTALMMGFFVILLAMNMGPKGGTPADQSDSQAAKESGQTPEALDWALGVREAFNNPVDINSTNPRDRILAMRLRERARSRGKASDPGIEGKHDRSQSLEQGTTHGSVASIRFGARSSDLTSDAKSVLNATAQKLRGNLQIIEVRGHISAAENAADPSYGVRLSFDRAYSVSEHLIQLGLDRRQLRLIACGDSELIKRRAYSTSDHQLNERVELIVTPEVMGTSPLLPHDR